MWLLLMSFVLAVQGRSLRPTSEHKETPCSFESGDYSLSWSYDDLSSDVVFKLAAHSDHTNFWSGVYIGQDKPTDAIGVFVRSGQIGLVDAHVTEDGIESDNLTNVQSLSFDLQDGKLTAEFARPLSPQDDTDSDLANCVTFFFPVVAPEIDMGGPIDVPTKMDSKRVCDLAVSCQSRDHASDLVKREDGPTCEYKNGKNRVAWRREADSYVFTIEQPNKKGKWWSAIGVGEGMSDMNALIAFTENGKLKHAGGYKSTGYTPPQKDGSAAPNFQQLKAGFANGMTHMEFSVGEDFLKPYLVGDCVKLQIGISAGHYGAQYAVGKHEETPVAFDACGIERCGAGAAEPKAEVVAEKHVEAQQPGTEQNTETASETQPENKTDIQPAQNTENRPEQQHPEVAVAAPVTSSAAPAAPVEVVAVTLPSTAAPVVPEGAVKEQKPPVELNADAPVAEENAALRNEVAQPAPEVSQNSSIEEGSGQSPGIFEQAIAAVDSIVESGSGEVPQSGGPPSNAPNAPDQPLTSEVKNDTAIQPITAEAHKNDSSIAGGAPIGAPSEQITEKTTPPSIQSPDGQNAVVLPNVDGQGGNVISQASNESSVTVLEGGANNASAEINVIQEGPKQESGDLHSMGGKKIEDGMKVTNAQDTNEHVPSNVDGSVKVQPVVPEVCEQDDLRVCEGYFNDYIGKVQEWADKHNHTVGSQMWKACKLLSGVKHVPSMCCHRFKQECGSFAAAPQQ